MAGACQMQQAWHDGGMPSRRDFLKQAAALASASALPSAIQKAMAIAPAPGTTWEDAEHVVILMQENRSFDHCLGSLQGVRGFNDPRAVTLPGGNPVWLQSNRAGETFPPFRMDIKGSNATWLGCLPHDWSDQSKARNHGKHDRWLDYKRPARGSVSHLPLTLGFHTREDLPFYYALADAFTVCDQNFCSSLTGTNPNRLHLWSGTIRPEPHPASMAHVRNHDAETHEGVKWKSFPERLEEHGVSWRVYQNELYLHTGLTAEETPWLGNFGDNALEFFARYRVRMARRHRDYLAGKLKETEAAWEKVQAQPKPWTPQLEQQAAGIENQLKFFRAEVGQWTEAAFAALPEEDKQLHRKAFTTNEADPHFRTLESVTYEDGSTPRTMKIPRGDVLHQFRADVATGKLPAVSWLVAPQLFSDHPDSPWYGAWYISEALDILTDKPELWRKTIFILCYDENDGYFDHIPPFVPPDPAQPWTGKVSDGIDPELEFVREKQEANHQRVFPRIPTHTGPIGLGYRVPLVIASPWSRGGYVNSEVFDHTSILKFLERFASRKAGRQIAETNISAWRRAICGDLTSVFRPAPAADAPQDNPGKVERRPFLESIHQAQFKPGPATPRPLSAEEQAAARRSLTALAAMPRQEKGTRPSCALPYELSVHGALAADGKLFAVEFAAGKARFGDRSSGAPFHVYAPGRCASADPAVSEECRTWAYAVKAGDRIRDEWPLALFPEGNYHLRIHGPNGFYREFRGSSAGPAITLTLDDPTDGVPALVVTSRIPDKPVTLEIAGLSYGAPAVNIQLSSSPLRLPLHVDKSHGWYHVHVTATGFPAYSQQLAGRLEHGRESRTDPLMGGEL